MRKRDLPIARAASCNCTARLSPIAPTVPCNCTANPAPFPSDGRRPRACPRQDQPRAPRRAAPRDGYHEVVSLMARVDIADTLTVARADRTVVECPGLEGGDTLVTRALNAFLAAAGPNRVSGRLPRRHREADPGRCGARWRVVRRRGGAAGCEPAVRRAALGRLPWSDVAATIGSDVPFFLGPAVAIARGRGVQLAPGPQLPPIAVVLAHPGRPLATRDVYEAYRAAGPVAGLGLPDPDSVPRRARRRSSSTTSGRWPSGSSPPAGRCAWS